MLQSVLTKVKPSDIRLHPFPHVVMRDALDTDYYNSLMDTFPSVETINVKGKSLINNDDCFLGAIDVVDNPAIAKNWREFFSHHVSQSFVLQALELISRPLLNIYPDLETRISKKLNRLSSTVADGTSDADTFVQCQFAINSPVIRESSVRTAHVDKPEKLFNALLYCRAPNDKTPGGDLVLYKFKKKPGFYGKRVAMPTRIEEVISIPYEANTLVLFLNSPISVHGVRPRPPTPHIRRYINLQVELSQKMFTLPNVNPILGMVERHIFAS